MIFRSLVFAITFVLISTCSFAQQYSHGPRQNGEAILDELLMGKSLFLVKVGSNGCTGKGSFRVDVKKQDGISQIAPHYVLTINRVAPDECKAIADEGIVISWDLEKDLGLKGSFTYSVRNMVYSVYDPVEDEESFLSLVAKQFGVAVPAKPRPQR